MVENNIVLEELDEKTEEEILEIQRMAEEMMQERKPQKDYEIEEVKEYDGETVPVEEVHYTNPYKLSVERRANSLAFEPIFDERTGEQRKDGFGNLAYQCIPVARKPKHLYCTECHDYKVFKKEDGLGRCPSCGMSDQDFYIKTANQLWETGKKSS